MIRRIRTLATTVALAAIILSMSGFKACEKQDQNVVFARNLLSATKAVEGIIVADHPELKAKWDKVIDGAGKIVDAVAISDGTTIATVITKTIASPRS